MSVSVFNFTFPDYFQEAEWLNLIYFCMVLAGEESGFFFVVVVFNATYVGIIIYTNHKLQNWFDS